MRSSHPERFSARYALRSLDPTPPRTAPTPPHPSGTQASVAVVPSLTPRPDRPAPSAEPCPSEASVKSPSPAFPGSAWPSPASSPFWVSASSPHSCAAASAPSNQSPAARAAPIGPPLAHGDQSPQMRRNRPLRGICQENQQRPDHANSRSTLFLLKTAARPNRYFRTSAFYPHRAPPLPTAFLLRV